MTDVAKFETEAALCAAFIAAVATEGKWRSFSETGGWDILLVREADGVQIGIEAKLTLNAKVIDQSLPSPFNYGETGPDYRAALIPGYATGSFGRVCGALGITVLRYGPGSLRIDPTLPLAGRRTWIDPNWHEWAPLRRVAVPDYIPDVPAGAPAPLTLTPWKVAAIKICVLLEERPVTRSDFKHLGIDPRRWTSPWPGWLRPTEKGYVADRLPDFKAQHPRNYEEIKADKEKWMPPMVRLPL